MFRCHTIRLKMVRLYDTTLYGILNTNICWNDFENRLRSALHTEARLGPKHEVLDIGDGIGYASVCCLITCHWIGAEEGEELPDKVVLKIPSFRPLRLLNESLPEGQKMFDYNDDKWRAMEGQLNGIHNTEVASYEFLDEFERLSIPKKFYAVRNFDPHSRGQLCIEYFENSQMMRECERPTVDQVRQVARALGKIQACSLNKEATAPELNKDFFANIWKLWPLETFRGMFKKILEHDTSEATRQLLDKIDALIPTYHGSNLASTLHKQMGLRPVLVNGDLHTGNVLVNKENGDLLALIDWQCAHLGVGVEDLHRIALSALQPDERRAAMPGLIEEMYASMVENLEGAGPPYTLEKLHLLSDLLFPHCALFFVGPFIANIDKTSGMLQDKAVTMEARLNKMIGVLEDIVELDIKNKKHLEYLHFKTE